MIDEILGNIDTEIKILREISLYEKRSDFSSGYERKLLTETITSLKKSLSLINSALPELIKEIKTGREFPVQKVLDRKESLEKINFKRENGDLKFVIDKKSREKLLKELSISENLIKKIERNKEKEENYSEFKAARGYLKLSNKFFLNKSIDLVNKGYFKNLYTELKKANMEILFEGYIAMMIFSSVLSFFIGLFIFIFLMVLDFNLSWPILSLYTGEIGSRILTTIWIPLVLPPAVFIFTYFYPSTERISIAKRIEQELPFATIHMSAISGSGISPVEIFKIIGLSREYKYLRKEIRKVLNQINIYGYDLVTALNNVARNTPSEKLAELFLGLSTTINSGGSLKEFFEKRSETLLNEYRLEREKYTKLAETFMDIYISVIIAAPMILMLLLIMISLSKISIGFTPFQITLLIIMVIALINTVFLIFLKIKQPAY